MGGVAVIVRFYISSFSCFELIVAYDCLILLHDLLS